MDSIVQRPEQQMFRLIQGLIESLEGVYASRQPARIEAAFRGLAEQVYRQAILHLDDKDACRAFLLPLWRELRTLRARLALIGPVPARFAFRLAGHMDLICHLVRALYNDDFRFRIEEHQRLLEALLFVPRTLVELVPSFKGDPWAEDAGLRVAIDSLVKMAVIRPVDPSADPPVYELTPFGRDALVDLRVDP